MLGKVKAGPPDIHRRRIPGLRGPETGSVKRWILLVSAYPLFREGLALLIRWRTNIECVQASSLTETREALRELHGRMVLAVVDVESLQEAGASVILSLHEAAPDVPVLALTPSQDPEQQRRVQRAGAREVLDLTVDIEQIVGTVRQMVGREPKT